MKVPAWMRNGGLPGRGKAPDGAKTVMLGGVSTVFVGAADDAYFMALERHAAGLDGLATSCRAMSRATPR